MADDQPQPLDQENRRFATSLRKARLALGKKYSYRRVDILSQELAAADPERFARTSHSLIWELESNDDSYPATRAISPGKIRSIVEIIYGGDMSRFLRETGYAGVGLHYEPSEDAPAGSVAEVPFYLELERPKDKGWDRFRPPLAPGVDFLVECRLSRMRPLLPPGMVAYCGLREDVAAGEIAVLLTAREGLVFAAHMGNGQYTHVSTQEVFQLGQDDHVYGVVQWIKPMFVP